eukprot:CAMPEP_0201103238 /NCGR_PEP_ID=MMETSP0812-20130820/27197_1 /ASSEMBLY_ACC=CAM_ASM_000668 /TAXON_ID=98059 /ORGANISM="Dinobryon sp., Strain UTEXLB2267" /LENGTH=49 /DNA_ID= /DNA_START= /DNA_END= /DNA_ORIENTATION=
MSVPAFPEAVHLVQMTVYMSVPEFPEAVHLENTTAPAFVEASQLDHMSA